MTQQKKGFTLIELMVVMAIIAVLAVLMIGAIQLARRTATETTNRSNAKTVQTGMEGYFAKNREYPVYSGVSFDSTKSTLGITSLGSTCGAETAGGGSPAIPAAKTTGGGQITSTKTSYTISPYNFDCSAVLTNDVVSN